MLSIMLPYLCFSCRLQRSAHHQATCPNSWGCRGLTSVSWPSTPAVLPAPSSFLMVALLRMVSLLLQTSTRQPDATSSSFHLSPGRFLVTMTRSLLSGPYT